MSRRRLAGNIVSALVLACGTGLLAPLSALAEESSNAALMIPNMTEFIPMTIAFFALWFIFAKWVYPVVMGMIDKRAQTITDNLKDAENSKVESAKMLEQRQAELDQAKNDAAKIIADAKKQAEEVKAQIEAEAREEAQAIIEKANASVETERKAVKLELQSSVADISVQVAGKLIGEDLDDDAHRRIIERYVEEAGNLNAS
ncbi:MAG: F0F1 ATP synthase subunit B [Coriobacteriales bacterium]